MARLYGKYDPSIRCLSQVEFQFQDLVSVVTHTLLPPADGNLGFSQVDCEFFKIQMDKVTCDSFVYLNRILSFENSLQSTEILRI